MAERSGFFNARLQDGTYDRTYQAEDFADCLSLFIPNGIYVEDSETLTGTIDKTTVQGLKPYASGTSLFIKKGKAFINGYWYILDEQDLEISLIVNTTKAIVLMYVAADRRMRVELLDLVDGQPNVPKTDAQYGILLGTVSYTSDGVSVTDLRTEFMLGSPQASHRVSEKTLESLNEYTEKIGLQDTKIQALNDRFFVVEKEVKKKKVFSTGLSEVSEESVDILSSDISSDPNFVFGNADDWKAIFIGEAYRVYYLRNGTEVPVTWSGNKYKGEFVTVVGGGAILSYPNINEHFVLNGGKIFRVSYNCAVVPFSEPGKTLYEDITVRFIFIKLK